MPRAVKEPLITCHDAAAATAGGTVVDVSGCSAVVIQVSGTFTATVVPKVTVDESNYITVEAVNLNDSSRTSSITAAGIYVVPVAGAALFKADMTWSAGTSITVKARALYDGLAEALMPDVQASSAVTSVTPGTTASSLGKAEDAQHTSGDVGVMSLAVRADTPAATGADGDYVPVLTDASGRLHVVQSTSTVGGAASIPAGTNNIGDVDVLTSPAYGTIATGEVQGNASATQNPSVACREVTIKAAYDNAGRVYIGGSSVTKADGTTDTTTGIQLLPGEAITLPITNLNLTYRICDNAGDDFTYIALT